VPDELERDKLCAATATHRLFRVRRCHSELHAKAGAPTPDGDRLKSVKGISDLLKASFTRLRKKS